MIRFVAAKLQTAAHLLRNRIRSTGASSIARIQRSEVKQGLPETSACFSAPEEFLIALTYGGESEWVKKVLADASLRLAA